MTILGVILLCPDTLLLREVQGAENWTVTFYRHLFIAIAMMICQTIADRNLQATYNSVWSLGYLGIFSGIVLGTSMLLFTIAVQNTAAANVLVINATNPIFSAIFSYLILGEFIDKKTFVVMLICFGAIILVFSTEFGNDAGVSAVAGNLCALGAAVTVGLYFVLIRLASIRNAEISMIQCNMLGGIVTSLGNIIHVILICVISLMCNMFIY
jgi:drug/metabolite transporter (DMT)-like permease